MTLSFGLIGAGRMGQVFGHHLAFSVSSVKLVTVADVNAAQAAEVAARYGAESSYTDYQELLERKDIDAVVIVTPTNTHVEVVKAAAAAGKLR